MDIVSVMIFQNGMVAVFDDQGKQVVELQGKYDEKKEMIAQAIGKQKELPEILKAPGYFLPGKLSD